jgi:hypothetical protein
MVMALNSNLPTGSQVARKPGRPRRARHRGEAPQGGIGQGIGQGGVCGRAWSRCDVWRDGVEVQSRARAVLAPGCSDSTSVNPATKLSTNSWGWVKAAASKLTATQPVSPCVTMVIIAAQPGRGP